MAVNSSFFHPVSLFCFFTKPSSFILSAFCITSILLLLPACILVTHLGLQRWRQQRSTSAAAAVTSHSDCFTYHMVGVQLIGLVGYTLCCGAIYRDVYDQLFNAGFHLWSFNWSAEMYFHILTCVERYLAVVHPVTYLSLRGERGTRIRNISIGCVLLLSVGTTTLMALDFMFLDFCLLFLSVTIVSFCSLSVLHILIRPGPGEQGGDRRRVDQSKRRAFYTIVLILGVLLLRLFGSVAWSVSTIWVKSVACLVSVCTIWFNLPCSLVLPLLFLHRAGTLPCCKKATSEDQDKI